MTNDLPPLLYDMSFRTQDLWIADVKKIEYLFYLIFHFGLLTSKKKLIRLAESYFFIDRSYLWKRLLFIIRLIV
jgi:hypothetical protein